ncbi:MAG: pentapeptide repeat-containing protein [Methanothrix sp.]|nr:pentapeptide repeat-containing protein [Methanothrix sp.]
MKWNDWRRANPGVKPDLSSANLSGIPLSIPNLRNVDFDDVSLRELGDLSLGEISGTNFRRIDLRWANLSDTNLEEADLRGQYLRGTKLNGSNLKNARLEYATLIDTDCDRVQLTGCRIYGISVWSLKGVPLDQSNLIITREGESKITADNLEVAQFIYLILNHKKLRDVINSVMKKGVLLLGRFENEGHEVLQLIAAKLREMNYLPIIFDFGRPEGKTFTDTVKTLAGLSRFVIVDLSGPSVPQELGAIMDFKVPIAPIIEDSRKPYSIFRDFYVNDWVLPIVKFASKEQLIEFLPSKIIIPLEEKCKKGQEKLDQCFNPLG